MTSQNLVLRNIPNFITILNLLAGCLAIIWSFDDLRIASLLIFAAAIFDFADGLAARALNAYSKIGKELDSLADIVSFGVAPAVILHHLISMSLILKDSSYSFEYASFSEQLIIFSPFLISVFAAIRLAKFNTDIRQEDHFLGLPTPATALFIASVTYVFHTADITIIGKYILSTPILIGLILVFCFLMISNIPMFSLKFSNLSFSRNKIRYLFILLALIAIIFLKVAAIPLLILIYIVLSPIQSWFD